MGEQILQQFSKILTLVEFEVVHLKLKLNSVKSHPIDSQLILLRQCNVKISEKSNYESDLSLKKKLLKIVQAVKL